MEQYQRANNLKIEGAPEEGGPTVIFKRIGQFVGELINYADIDICHSVPIQKPAEKKNIVRSVQRSKKKLAQ